MCGPHLRFGDLSLRPHRCWEEQAEKGKGK